MSDHVKTSNRKSIFAVGVRERLLMTAATMGFFLLLGLLQVGLNMRRGLNHDEHQFVASAALIARDSLLPYRDFSYFHVPLLSLVYALLMPSWERLLLVMRLFSVLMAWLTMWLIFAVGFRRRLAPSLRERATFAALGTLWLAALPLFTYTSGRAWNHDLALLFLLLAFFIHSDTLIERRSPWWLGASGLLMGMAAATRLSFALVAIPFLLVIWLYPVYPVGMRWRASLAFVVGTAVGSLPALALFVADPAAFWFGNVEYIGLNTAYYRAAGATSAMTLFDKLRYLGELLIFQPADGLAVVVLIIGLVPLVRALRSRLPFVRSGAPPTPKEESLFRLAFVLLLLAFALLGALAATPSQPQYFYALFPLVILGIIYALTAWPAHMRVAGLRVFIVAAVASIILAVPAYLPGLAIVFKPAEWLPNKLHAHGNWAMSLTGDGPILTLSPIPVLEGRGAIYPEFATGPFAWRVAPLVDAARRSELHLVAPSDLEQFLESEPPAAILVGLDNDDVAEEQPLVDYAQKHAFVPVPMPDDGTLWLAPRARWADTIQLGGHDLPTRLLRPGETFVLTLYLQNRVELTRNLNILVRFIDEQGETLDEAEGWPYGSPTSTWSVGQVWPHGHEFTIPGTAAPGYYRVEVSFYNPADLAQVGAPATIGYITVVDDDAARASPAAPLAVYSDTIALTDASIDRARLAAGERLPVQMTWQALQPIDADLVKFLHVLDIEGRLVAQHDGPPGGGFVPTSAWIPQLPRTDQLTIALPDDLTAGQYRLQVGLYDEETLVRLPVTAGAEDGATVIELGTIEIE